MAKIKKAMITDFKKFQAAWEKDAGKPEHTIMYYIIAALNIEDDPKLAEAMMTLLVHKDHCLPDKKSPSGLKLGRSAKYFIGQFKKNPRIAASYVGGTPENGYKYTKSDLAMTVVSKQDYQKGYKIFIQSGGKDNPTPLQVRENSSGQWKLVEYSSVCTGVQKTPQEKGDF